MLLETYLLRTERGDYTISDKHLTDAIEKLVQKTACTLSPVREPKKADR